MSTKAHTAKEAASEQHQKTRILVIEDNDDIRRSLAKLFEMEHFEVVTANDGPDGVHLADNQTPDAVIVDINLPHLSGVDVIKILRRQPRFSVIPIMAITAYGNWW